MSFHQHILKKEKAALLRITILSFLIVMACSALSAQVPADTTMATPPIKKPTKGNHHSNDDTSGNLILSDILACETKSKSKRMFFNSYQDYHSSHFINIFYNNGFMRFQKISSSETVTQKYDNSFGIGLQCGHIFNLNSKPIEDFLCFGIDLSLIDFSVNTFKRIDLPSETILSEKGGNLKDIPLNHSKTSINYGISAGPSLSLYPFNDHSLISIRFQLYYHLGYDVDWVLLKDVNEKTEKIWGHGFYSCIGANISWSSFGIGYEFRNNLKTKYKPINTDYSTYTIKADQQANRFYVQFRF